MIINRIGDFGLALGIFAIFINSGSIDYAVVFSNAYLFEQTNFLFFGFNVDFITIVGFLLFIGAVGKSAQIGLHT